MLLLRVLPPGGPSWEHRPRGESLVVGRSRGCDLVLADEYLSRRHARLFRRDGGWWIEDLGSRNGTRLDGRLLDGPAPVAPGQVVQISASRLEILSPGAAAPLAEAETGSFGAVTAFLPAADLLRGTVSGARAGTGAGTGAVGGAGDASSAGLHLGRLRLLHEVHRELARSVAPEEILERLLDRVFDHLRPERGAVYLRQPDGNLHPAARRSLDGPAEAVTHPPALAAVVAGRGLAARLADAGSDARFAAHPELAGRALLAAPLLADAGESLGMIVLDAASGARTFREEDLELLVSLASAAALRLRNLELSAEAAERRRMSDELALARRIQVALLSDRLPETPGWELHAGNVPSRGVSGDLYKVFRRQDDLVAVLADVSGKGMAASLLTASLEALLAAVLASGDAPGAVADRVSRRLHERTPPDKFATAFLAALPLAGGRVLWASAGHHPAVVLHRDGSSEQLAATGPPLGLLVEATYDTETVELAPGDVLIAYTDGLIEAADARGEEFGVDRLLEVCRRTGPAPAARIGAAVEAAVTAFAAGTPYADDRTLLVVRRVPDAGPAEDASAQEGPAG